MLEPESGFGWEAEQIFQSAKETFLFAEVSSSISLIQREVFSGEFISYCFSFFCLLVFSP